MIGSFEFATAVAGAKLLLVLGHSDCGAVKGSIDREAVKSVDIEVSNGVIHVIDSVIMPPAGNNMAPKGEKKY